MKIKINTLLAYLVFIFFNWLYFYFFVFTQQIDVDNPLHLEYYSFFYYPINFDYLFYFDYYKELIRSGDWPVFIYNPNFWISFFYDYLGELIPIGRDNLAFFVNNVLIVASFYLITRILKNARLNTKYCFIFFLNPQLIYYSQLINKEAPTLFFVLWITYLIQMDKKILLVIATILATMTREQLILYPLFVYFLYFSNNYKLSLIYSYVLSSALAVYFAIQNTVNDPNPFGSSGFVKFIFDMNVNYYIGNLLFSPLKIIQWVYEQLGALAFISDDGYIDLSKLRDIGVIFTLALSWRKLVRIFSSIESSSSGSSRILLSSIFAYVLVLLINPIVHARYLFPIEILLVVLVVAVSEKHFKNEFLRV